MILLGFNTQPPKGGWLRSSRIASQQRGFNTQPPKGGWDPNLVRAVMVQVSTHSRLKAAGQAQGDLGCLFAVSTHSRLKAAGRIVPYIHYIRKVSTHSRLKAAGFIMAFGTFISNSFNTQPPKGGW